jgi:hypothetical protein
MKASLNNMFEWQQSTYTSAVFFQFLNNYNPFLLCLQPINRLHLNTDK